MRRICYFTQPTTLTVHADKIYYGINIDFVRHQPLYNIKLDIWNVLKRNGLHKNVKLIEDIIVKIGDKKWEDFESSVARGDVLNRNGHHLDIYFKNLL